MRQFIKNLTEIHSNTIEILHDNDESFFTLAPNLLLQNIIDLLAEEAEKDELTEDEELWLDLLLICPKTDRELDDPVIIADGTTYNREALLHPATQKPVVAFANNVAISEFIEEYKHYKQKETPSNLLELWKNNNSHSDETNLQIDHNYPVSSDFLEIEEQKNPSRNDFFNSHNKAIQSTRLSEAGITSDEILKEQPLQEVALNHFSF